MGWTCFLQKFSGSPVATSPFFGVFQKVPTWATGALDSTVEVAMLLKILFKGGGAHMLKKLQDIDVNLCVANEGQWLSKGICNMPIMATINILKQT